MFSASHEARPEIRDARLLRQELAARVHIQAAIDAFDVVVNGVSAEAKLPGDLLFAQSLLNEPQDLCLPPRHFRGRFFGRLGSRRFPESRDFSVEDVHDLSLSPPKVLPVAMSPAAKTTSTMAATGQMICHSFILHN